MYCKNCGKQIDDNAAVCIHCGVAVADYQQPVINIVNTNTNVNSAMSCPRKKKWTAFWLCFFLGLVGAHRFYVGKTGTGILWLLTGGFFYIGAVVDLFAILFGGFRDKAGNPLV